VAKRLRILHLSDLHIGKEHGDGLWRVERVMGEAWDRNLAEIRRDGPIDFVCFTGDLAQSGKPEQYADALKLVDAVLHSLDCPRDRFFCVPGNHDVDRSIARDAWDKLRELQWHDPQGLSRWMAGGKAPFGCDDAWRDAAIDRQRAYCEFLKAVGLPHLLPGQFDNPHPRLGYRRTLDLGFGAPLHIIGFDSAWLAGDDGDAGKLRLTDDQIGRLMTGDDGRRLPGWSIGLIHHPLTDLADARDAQRLLGEYGLGLLLHGHQHDPVIERWSDPQTALPIFAAGCLYEHPRYPNGLLVIDIDLSEAERLRPRQAWARKWSHRRSEWIDDDELYRGTRNGRLRLIPDDPAHFTPTPGDFIGRKKELEALCDAMLSSARGETAVATVICCAIDGMPGVGKTRLAEEFITRHWLKECPPPPDTPVGACVLRLVLAAGDDAAQTRSADTLLRDLAGC
jgi:predicted phosphodiesterase